MHREGGCIQVSYTLHRIIIHIDMADNRLLWIQFVGQYRIAVVLGSDVGFVLCQVLYGITSAMAVFQFFRVPSIGQRRQLVAQADAKYGLFP